MMSWAELSEARNKSSSENIQPWPQTAQTLPVMLPADGGGEGFIPQTEQFLPWKTCNANIGFVTVMCQPGSARHTSYSSHTVRLNMLSKYW